MEKEIVDNSDDQFPTPSLQWNDIFKFIGSVAGFVGVGGALLWLFGRSFYAGHFSALGFSSPTVSIAPEDYLEKGTTSLIYFVLDILFTLFLYYLAYLFKIFYYEKIFRRTKRYITRTASILLVFAIGVTTGVLLTDTSTLGISSNYFYEDIINLFSIFMIFMGLETAFLFASPHEGKIQNGASETQSIISSQTPIALARVLILIAMLGNFLVIQSSSSFISGYMSGCVTTLRISSPVVIFTNNPIFTEGQTQVNGLYTYEGYFLLFTDKENYYLFREINPDNYRPKDYYVVSKDTAKTIQIKRISVSSDEIKKYSEMCTNKIKSD